MKKIILACLVLLASCLPEATKLKCTLIGSENTLALKIDAEDGSSLPSNLAIRLKANGSEVSVDECTSNSSIFVEQDRSSVAARFSIDEDQDVADFYFPGESVDPVVDTAAFEILKRANCASVLESVVERPNIVISWLPVFANGEECGKTSNTGYSSFKLTP
jgi:hypothetical protein